MSSKKIAISWIFLCVFVFSAIINVQVSLPTLALKDEPISHTETEIDRSLRSTNNEATVETKPIDQIDTQEDYFGNKVVQGDFVSNEQVINPIDQKKSKEYEAEPEYVLNIDTDKRVYLPGQQINFIVQGRADFESYTGYITIRIYKGICYPWYERYDYNSGDYQLLSSSYVKMENGEYHSSFTAESADEYTILVWKDSSDYYGEYAYKVISVSELAVFWRLPSYSMQYESIPTYLQVLDVTDFSPVPAVNIEVTYAIGSFIDYEFQVNETLLYSGVTDEEGFLYFSLEMPMNFDSYNNHYSSVQVHAVKDEDSVTQSAYLNIISEDNYYGLDRYDFIVTTDKPIYLPGETLQGRVLVFENSYNNATKIPKQNIELKMTFISPLRIEIFSRYLVTNKYGVATFSITFDGDSELGDYSLEFKKDNVFFSKSITIDRYEKPAFRVNINSKDYMSTSDLFEGMLHAEYYFGQPVVDGTVQISILASSITENHYYDYERGEYIEAEPSESELIMEFTGQTNSKGEYYFSFRLSKDYNNARPYSNRYIEIQAQITDPADRQVTITKKVSTNDQLYLYAYTHPYLPELDRPFSINYFAYDQALSSINGAELEITIIAANTWNVKILRSKKIHIDSSYGSESFNISKKEISGYRSFILKLKLVVEDGRTQDYRRELEFTKIELSINVNPQVSSSGETVAITLEWSPLYYLAASFKPRVYLDVYDADQDRIISFEGEISRQHTFYLKLTDFAPSGTYRIIAYAIQVSSYYWVQYSSIHQDFIVNSANSLKLMQEQEKYEIGDKITIDGSFDGSTNAPIFVEVVKRGIVGLFTMESSSFSVSFEATTKLAPKIFVFSLTVDDEGRVYETHTVIEIKLDINVNVETDKEVYEPSEHAKINITFTNNKGYKLAGTTCISFIDSSVFGVKEDPEEELEHLDTLSYWPNVRTYTSWRTPRRGYYWYYWDIYPFYPYAYRGSGWYSQAVPTGMSQDEVDVFAESGSKAPGAIDAPPKEVEIRDNLLESMYWFSDIFGESISLKIALPDNIGEWTIRIFFTLGTGQGTLVKHTFFTRLPFFVEMEKPATSLQDDIVSVKGIVYNYKKAEVMANISIEVNELIILNRKWQIVYIPANYLAFVTWNIFANKFGDYNITIIAKTIEVNSSSDGLRKKLHIEPNGVNLQYKDGGLVADNRTFSVDILPEMVKQTTSLVLSQSNEQIVLSSWERLIGYPYGCVEQTLSRLVPTVLVLQYLNQTGELTAYSQASLENMVQAGLTRLASFQHADGGWGWWRDDGSKVFMTAYVLYGLSYVAEWFDVSNSDMVLNGLNYLIENQEDSHWTSNNWWPLDSQSFTTFVIRTLASFYPILSEEGQSALQYAETWFKNNWNSLNYAAVLYLDAIQMSSYPQGLIDDDLKQSLVDHLATNYKVDGEGKIYWTDEDNSDYRYRSLGGHVELTALVIKVLTKNSYANHVFVINDGLDWLLSRQRRWGWGNTYDTAAAIVAISELAQLNSGALNETVTVRVNGDIIQQFKFDTENKSSLAVQYLDLSDELSEGQNTVTISRDKVNSTGFISSYFTSNQILRETLAYSVETAYAAPNQVIRHTLTLSTSSENLIAANIQVTALDDRVMGQTVQTVHYLENTTVLEFMYKEIAELGSYHFAGYAIQYRLMDIYNTSMSPGLIHLSIKNFKVQIDNDFSSDLTTNKPFRVERSTSNNMNLHSTVTSKQISVTQSVTSPLNIVKGSSIQVTIQITNNEDETLRLLILEGILPTGTEFDVTTTLPSFITSYKVKTSTIEFYIDALSPGETLTFTYRLNAISLRASSLPTLTLSSMYDDWSVTSNAVVIGTESVAYNEAGSIVTDVMVPQIDDVTYIQSGDSISFTVKANDENGIDSVYILFEDEQDTWYRILMKQQVDSTWNGTFDSLSFTRTKNRAIVVVTDKYGNVVYSSKPLIIDIRFPPQMIPIVLILLFVLISIGVATGVATITRKKILEN